MSKRSNSPEVERDGSTCLGQLPGADIQVKIAKLHHFGAAGILGAAQHRAHSRQQLAGIEGLAHVVVGADFQSDDAIHIFALGGDDDDGDVRGALEALGYGEAILAGQHQIENQEVHAATGERVIHRSSVSYRNDVVALLDQKGRD